MKNLFSFLILLISFSLTAQKEITKEVKYENQSVKVEFPFASDIQIKTWDKSSIKVEASISTEDEKYIEMFDLHISSDESLIQIESNSKDIFKIFQDEIGDSSGRYHIGSDHEFNYVLYIPKNVDLKVSSITANVFSKFLQGDIDIKVVSGDIEVEKHQGNLKLKTVAGKIEAVYDNASVMAKTVVGEIYTSKTLNLDIKEKFVGQEVSMEIENAKNSLSLTTVNGDIYLK
ncbi:DUF4097 family beta strand repeat-containing protein [Gramella sp. KN1008]|uniref:DUF4097 family beta strand repeat-containing protein n=1 Tax=Gramella sp. KN1008 TaxID=2529298 RepID=UPI0013F14B55|nr:DUF4097 family beta strand repeat-containing protein [Gramella sp. KN1008]